MSAISSIKGESECNLLHSCLPVTDDDADCGTKAAVGFLRVMVGVQNAHDVGIATNRESALAFSSAFTILPFCVTTSQPSPTVVSVNGL